MQSCVLRPLVKTDRCHGIDQLNSNNPYVAFRRRNERIQTRKNRKSDENAYERLVKLKRDLLKAMALMELVKQRETLKRSQVLLGLELFQTRLSNGDWAMRTVIQEEDGVYLSEEDEDIEEISESNPTLSISLSSSNLHAKKNSHEEEKVC